MQRIADLEAKWKAVTPNEAAEKAQTAWLLSQINQFRRDPKSLDLTKPPRLPDGSPIGMDD